MEVQKKYFGDDVAKIEMYDPVKNHWVIRWDLKSQDGRVIGQEKIFMYKPSIEEIRALIFSYYNGQCDKEILQGFTFEGKTVWLTMENQINYKAALDLAIHTNGESLPVNFKFGTDESPEYITFSTIEELRAFVIDMIKYIGITQAKFWQIKSNINLEEYSV
ncbi:hypothetical protein [Sphingobacterium multivorum]|uniref:hypothetical protein n=1 Tax=Sphingobacterium multivorum TaxID=28454 RepID=UPI0031BA5E24